MATFRLRPPRRHLAPTRKLAPITNRTINRNTNRIMNRIINQTINRNTNRIINRIINQTINRITNRITNRTAQTINRVINQIINRITSRIISRITINRFRFLVQLRFLVRFSSSSRNLDTSTDRLIRCIRLVRWSLIRCMCGSLIIRTRGSLIRRAHLTSTRQWNPSDRQTFIHPRNRDRPLPVTASPKLLPSNLTDIKLPVLIHTHPEPMIRKFFPSTPSPSTGRKRNSFPSAWSKSNILPAFRR